MSRTQSFNMSRTYDNFMTQRLHVRQRTIFISALFKLIKIGSITIDERDVYLSLRFT